MPTSKSNSHRRPIAISFISISHTIAGVAVAVATAHASRTEAMFDSRGPRKQQMPTFDLICGFDVNQRLTREHRRQRRRAE